MFHARSDIQHLNATEREEGGPLIYPVNYFTIRQRGSGYLTGAWKWRTFFAHFHSEPLLVSVPASFPLMLFPPADHVPIFGKWYYLGCEEHGYRVFLFVNLSYGVGPCCFLFSYRLSSADELGI